MCRSVWSQNSPHYYRYMAPVAWESRQKLDFQNALYWNCHKMISFIMIPLGDLILWQNQNFQHCPGFFMEVSYYTIKSVLQNSRQILVGRDKVQAKRWIHQNFNQAFLWRTISFQSLQTQNITLRGVHTRFCQPFVQLHSFRTRLFFSHECRMWPTFHGSL